LYILRQIRFLFCETAKADIVEFDFETDDTANPAFSAAIDTGPDFTGTQDGITFTATATGGNGSPNTGGSGIGVGGNTNREAHQ